MSHRDREHRRRERSWEKEDRDRSDKYSRGGHSSFREEPRRRSSRSRSPRRGDRERRDHRDYRRDDRRERDSRRHDDSRGKDRSRERERERDRETDRDRELDRKGEGRDSSRREVPAPRDPPHSDSLSTSKQVPEYFSNNDNAEAGETVEDENDAMMAMMGVAGFGSTKGKHVEGNQEGSVNVKKSRTWRQYMNRRGGFNRPLDKIK